MNDGETQLTEELDLVKCMYPEIQVEKEDEQQLIINLDICTVSETNVLVVYDSLSVMVDELPGTTLRLVVNKVFYPHFPSSLELSVTSTWMSDHDVLKIKDAVIDQFIDSDSQDDTPLMSLLIDYLINETLRILTNEKGLYIAKSKDQWNKFNTLITNMGLKRFNNQNFDCCICIDTKKGIQMISLPCHEHYLCRDCLKEYYHTMINEGRMENMRCPECKNEEVLLKSYGSFESLKKSLFEPVLPFSFFEGFLPIEDVKRYKQLYIQDAFLKLSQYSPYSCTVCPRCDQWCVKDSLDENLIHCNNCDMYFCFNCLHSWHGKHNPCGKKKSIGEEFIIEYADKCTPDERKKELEVKFGKKTMELELDSYLADKMLEMALQDENFNMKKCPGCNTIIEKSEGCNKMKCSVCFMTFCFLCAVILDPEDPYSHYNEPLSTCMGRLFEGMPGTEENA